MFASQQHFAIGLVVNVRDGAYPAGLSESAQVAGAVGRLPIEDVHEPSVHGGDVHGRCTYQVNGWWYYPEDLEIVR